MNSSNVQPSLDQLVRWFRVQIVYRRTIKAAVHLSCDSECLPATVIALVMLITFLARFPILINVYCLIKYIYWVSFAPTLACL